jgi:hypothetical protein
MLRRLQPAAETGNSQITLTRVIRKKLQWGVANNLFYYHTDNTAGSMILYEEVITQKNSIRKT